jgi:ABC-type uncharacterized transport system involved in gliding motility auxiliary subunit/ABC-type transport system involved in multi-copper enzyme maturation permease subunit
MRNIFTIAKRELGAYFNSAIAYIYLIVFIAINNSLFITRYFLIGKADMKLYFDSLPLILFIFIPVITMRLWAEDKKVHTYELLLTFPMKPAELVLGKFFASLIFYLISLLSTVTIPIILYLSGQPDPGAIFGGYLGSLLIGVLFLAIGIFISGLTQEQIVAFVLTTLSCFAIFYLGTDFFASFIDGWTAGLGTFLKNYVGAASHLISFSKGVIDLKDILYFVIASAAFLLLNGFFLEGRLRPKAKIVFSLSVLICLVGVILFNWLVHDLPIGRFDVTENKIYTVSDTAKKIFKDLKTQVLVNLYITPAEKMPTYFKTLQQDIVGKLEELRVASNNKFNFKVFHIEAARLLEEKKAEENAEKEKGPESLEKTLEDKGIMPFQVQSIDKDEVGLKLVYSALSLSYKEKSEEILPHILPQTLPDLEYLLFSRIMKLMQEKKPRIAVLAALKAEEVSPEMSELLSQTAKDNKPQYEDEYKTIVSLMRNNGYDVQRITLTKESPIIEDTSILMMMNPGPLNDRQVYEVNKFLYQGGTVFLAAHGFNYSFQITPPSGLEVSPQKLNLDINKLIKKWGISINEDMLMDENSEIIEVSTGQRVGPFALSMPVKIPNQISVRYDTMNKNMLLMTRLPSLLYLWGSALDVSDDILKQFGLKKSVMFTSSPRSWKVAYEGGNLKKESLVFPKSGSEGKFILGLMVDGQFSNTFAQAKLPEWPKEKEEKPEEPVKLEEKKADMENPKPAKLIVIGCSKMFNDDLITNPGNLGLFSNIVDGLTLGESIVKIRAKAYASRDIKKVNDNQKIFYRFIAIFLVPLLLIIYAAIRLFLRSKEKQFYMMAREK